MGLFEELFNPPQKPFAPKKPPTQKARPEVKKIEERPQRIELTDEPCFEEDLPENAIHFCLAHEVEDEGELAKFIIIGEVLNKPRFKCGRWGKY
jgi:hypothetical protein